MAKIAIVSTMQNSRTMAAVSATKRSKACSKVTVPPKD